MGQEFADIPRVYTAVAEILAVYLYGLILHVKGRKNMYTAYALVMLLWQAVYMIGTGRLPIGWWIPVMLAALLFMYGFLFVFTSLDWKTTAYFCLKAFVLAEFMASLGWQLVCFAGLSGTGGAAAGGAERSGSTFLSAALMLGVYALSVGIYFVLERKIIDTSQKNMISTQELVTAALVVLLVFTFSNLGFLTIKTPFSGAGPADTFNVRTLVDLIGIILLYAIQSRMYQLHSERELARIQVMLKNQYDKYKNFQESITRINRKYHDLKHAIAGLCVDMDDKEKAEWSLLINRELNFYRPDIQTGSHVLDTIIDSKTVFFNRNHIQFTCVADGALLDFIHVTDLCTIFGNALDCAMEDVYLVEDPDQRVIHLTVSEKKGFLFIFLENFTEGKRKDYEYEQKCMEYSVEKYHGTMSVKQKKDWQELQILIPLSQGKKKK